MTRLRGIMTNMHAKVPKKFNAKVELQETVHALVAGGHTSGEEGTESKKKPLPSLTHLAPTTLGSKFIHLLHDGTVSNLCHFYMKETDVSFP